MIDHKVSDQRYQELLDAEAEVARLRERFINHLVRIDGFSHEAAELMVDKAPLGQPEDL